MKNVIIIVMVGLIAFFSIKSCSINSEGDVSTGEAQIMAEDFVKNSLKSPSTADFSNASTQDIGDKTFIVSGNVDAENSFGAMLRNTYRVKLKYNGGEWEDSNNWTLIDIDLHQ